jgi:hypothetical protein
MVMTISGRRSERCRMRSRLWFAVVLLPYDVAFLPAVRALKHSLVTYAAAYIAVVVPTAGLTCDAFPFPASGHLSWFLHRAAC